MNIERGTPVLVTTKHRGVFFGYYAEGGKEELALTGARNCIYWSQETHGFLGLASSGPAEGSRIGPKIDNLTLYDITSVSMVTPDAVQRWESAQWK